MGATAAQDIWGRSPLPPSAFEPLIVHRSLVTTDYASFNMSSYILSVFERPDRTREKNGDNFMLRNFLICIPRHIIRLNNDDSVEDIRGKRKTMPLRRSTCRWKGNIKMDLGEVGCQTGLNSSCFCYCTVPKRCEPYGYIRGGELVH
jgi:hypothetical protein